MKLTKVERNRIAVSRYEDETGRSILYPVPNQDEITVTKKKIRERVEHANRLYHVFFRNDVPIDLEKHFVEICKIASRSNKNNLLTNLMNYREYGVSGKNFKKQISKFEYGSSSRKDLTDVLNLHIKQRMGEEWQQESNSKIVVAILKCICNGKKYEEEIKKLFKYKKEDLFLFMNLCKEQKAKPYVESTSNLEDVFSLVMKAVAQKCDVDAYYKDDVDAIEKNLKVQLKFLENIRTVKVKKNQKDAPQIIELKQFSYAYATQERMNAILVRMRKSLKRDNYRQIAIKLLQAIAQTENQSLSSVIKQMKEDEQQYLQLKKFLIAVNKDYHHINIVMSIKNMDIKVQLNEKQLDLSSVKNEKKKVLNETLEQYASSKENSDEVLLKIKTILFDYFSIEDKEKKFLAKEKIWSFPTNDIRYFDSEFVAFGSNEESNQVTLEKFLVDGNYISKGKDRAIKKRINYVNYGKYLKLTVNESDPFRQYWFSFIKEYIEKEIVKREGLLQEQDCFNSTIMVKCWKYLIRFLCGKYIDIGKSVYHFVVPEDMTIKKDVLYNEIRSEYESGISSFALEVIKAEETRQRAIAHATATATSNFSRAIVNYSSEKLKELIHPEDIITMSESIVKDILRDDIGKQILRFYGGFSSFSQKDKLIKEQSIEKVIENQEETQKLALELLGHFKKLRNANFHYTEGKEVKITGDYTEFLIENDQKAYEQIVRKRYYSNNASMFYKEQDIVTLVKRLYSHTKWNEAQIPAFRTVWKQKDMVEDLEAWKEITLFPEWQLDKNKTMQFTVALYYLLKEIYYREFIGGTEIKERFFKAVDNYVNKYKSEKFYNRKYLNAGTNFQNYVNKLQNESFGTICQSVMQEYNQQNAKEENEEIYKHFKILLPLCIKHAFQDYINEKEEYSFLRNPYCYERIGEPVYLEEVGIQYHFTSHKKDSAKLYEWYTLAHFISPRQLNFFVGEWKNYIQYRKDIFRRSEYANQFKNNTSLYEKEKSNMEIKVAQAEAIVEMLEFVRQVTGKVSNNFYDYYKDEEDYAKYIYQYIDFELLDDKMYFSSLKQFCQNTLPDGEIIDIYADAENPKVLRNIELARMYAGGDIYLEGHKKICSDEIKEYYKNKKEIIQIQAKGLCKNEEQQKKVKKQQELKNRITLHNVTDYYELTNDLLGQLISLSYLRERDYMYLLLGFYYMALRSKDDWNGEVWNAVQDAKYQIKGGFILYQIIGVFDYGIGLLYKNSKNKWKTIGGEISDKIRKFDSYHKISLAYALRLLENGTYAKEISNLRNYVDHSKYYMNHDKSLLELYNEFYAKFFGYSEKLKQNVLHSFQSILEDYFVVYKVKFKEKGFYIDDNLESMMFTYKLKDKKTTNVPARNKEYLKELKQVLEYKK